MDSLGRTDTSVSGYSITVLHLYSNTVLVPGVTIALQTSPARATRVQLSDRTRSLSNIISVPFSLRSSVLFYGAYSDAHPPSIYLAHRRSPAVLADGSESSS